MFCPETGSFFRRSQGVHIRPPSPGLPRQRTEPVRIQRSSAEMSAEPDGKQIAPCCAFRHMKFPGDDGGAADLVVVKHPVCGPAFRFPAGPVREEDHPPERFRVRHVVAFPRSVVLFRLVEDLFHADSMICSDFFVVFTHDEKLHLSVLIGTVLLRGKSHAIYTYKCTIEWAANGSSCSFLLEGDLRVDEGSDPDVPNRNRSCSCGSGENIA